ncbi:hypothetical protein EYF80_035364 [Liparis tanakae]|uniref:Uncharacterized protein n=1 Tax=Liparis tanakae TaxID=230148 RepID=A0A4Z2GML4_9TELE|nr:hypothetical protein EYF80_035364 [Liparis tanakae]
MTPAPVPELAAQLQVKPLQVFFKLLPHVFSHLHHCGVESRPQATLLLIPGLDSGRTSAVLRRPARVSCEVHS